MSIIFAVLGLTVLLLGQRIFWLALGSLAWMWAMNLLGHPLEALGDGAVIVIAVIIAVVAGALARTRRQVALALSGVVAGSLAISVMTELAGVDLGILFWPSIVAGALAGFLVATRLPGRGVILLFSICGAAALPLSFELQHQSNLIASVLFLASIPIGFFTQSRLLKAPSSPTPSVAA